VVVVSVTVAWGGGSVTAGSGGVGSVTGGSGRDWFFVNLGRKKDKINGLDGLEFVDQPQ